MITSQSGMIQQQQRFFFGDIKQDFEKKNKILLMPTIELILSA